MTRSRFLFRFIAFLILTTLLLPALPARARQAETPPQVGIQGGDGWAGQYSSLALNIQGYPVISYFDNNIGALKLAVCGDATCSSSSLTTVDSKDYAGTHTSLALNSQGYPVISYYDPYPNFDLKLATCNDAYCNSKTITIVDSSGYVGEYNSLALNSQGYPVISYIDSTNFDLKLAVCEDTTCTSKALYTVDSTGNVGEYNSLALNDQGYPVISYYDYTNGDLKLLVCGDANCSSKTFTSVDTSGNVGQHTSLALDSNNFPVISYFDSTNSDLKVAACSDTTCSSSSLTTVDNSGEVGEFSSVKLDSQGYPVISYWISTNSDLKLAVCADAACSSSSLTNVESAGYVGTFTALALDSQDKPVISYFGADNLDLRLAACGDAKCSSSNTIRSLDGGSYFTISGIVGKGDVSVAAAGSPISRFTTSDTGGNYSLDLPIGWIGSVTPSRENYVFTPAKFDYGALYADYSNQDFAAAFDCTKVTEIPKAECDVLAALYSGTGGNSWTHSTGWLQNTTVCSQPWYGITCAAGHVSAIKIYSNNLTGAIPSALGSLTELDTLFLNDNQLSGEIPRELGSLANLMGLRLANNQLGGVIPAELANLTLLSEITLDCGVFRINDSGLWNFLVPHYFSASCFLPGDFSKSGPINGVTGQALTVTLKWNGSINAASYELCYTSAASCTSWPNVGKVTSMVVSGLQAGKKYTWQVYAKNSTGTTLASEGAWSFTTGSAPGVFSKTTPANAATGVALAPTLKWNASAGAASYELCYGTSSTCSSWTNIGNVTSKAITGLQAGTKYYWQVRAKNAIGTTAASGGTWYFITGSAPSVFSKTAPQNGATGVSVTPILKWNASASAQRYEVCYATKTTCTSWINVGNFTSKVLPTLKKNTIYYWQVRSVNAFGTTLASGGTWKFTTVK